MRLDRNLGLFAAIFGGVGVLALSLAVAFHLHRRSEWRRWPHVEATVADYEFFDGDQRPVYRYRYNGRDLETHSGWYTNEAGPEVGSKVALAIDPAHPRDYVTAPSIPFGLAILVLLGGALTAMGLLFLWAAARAERVDVIRTPENLHVETVLPAPAVLLWILGGDSRPSAFGRFALFLVLLLSSIGLYHHFYEPESGPDLTRLWPWVEFLGVAYVVLRLVGGWMERSKDG